MRERKSGKKKTAVVVEGVDSSLLFSPPPLAQRGPASRHERKHLGCTQDRV